MPGVAVHVRDLTVAYATTTVLAKVSFTVSPGQAVAIMGPSGSGKSTLLGCITGTLRPSSGSVQIGETRVSDLDGPARARFRRRHMGLMFQLPELLPELNVEENVALPQLFDGVPRKQALAAARSSLKLVGMQHHAVKRIDEISGGEAQRVALARSLSRPQMHVLAADEPTASLDARNARVVTDLILSRAHSVGAATVIATHDVAVAQMCDRTIVLTEANEAALA